MIQGGGAVPVRALPVREGSGILKGVEYTKTCTCERERVFPTVSAWSQNRVVLLHVLHVHPI